jgi:hypothetical protein
MNQSQPPAKPTPQPSPQPTPQPPPRAPSPSAAALRQALMPEPKRPSRFARFLRRALGWAIGVVVIFALGIGAMWATRLRPQAETIRRLEGDLNAAQTELETLRPLQAENERLRSEAAIARQRLALTEAQVDVSRAQAALALGDSLAARSALSQTDSHLQTIEGLLQDPAALQQMQDLHERLALVFSELETNPFAARSDLEVMVDSLASLKDALPAP